MFLDNLIFSVSLLVSFVSSIILSISTKKEVLNSKLYISYAKYLAVLMLVFLSEKTIYTVLVASLFFLFKDFIKKFEKPILAISSGFLCYSFVNFVACFFIAFFQGTLFTYSHLNLKKKKEIFLNSFKSGMPFVAVFVLFSLLSDPNYFSFFNGLLLYCFLVGVDSDYRD